MVFLTPNAWNFNTWLIRAVPNQLHDHFTRRLYGREKQDTYLVRYRLNTPRRLRQVLDAAGLRQDRLIVNPDPTYLSFDRYSFAAARALERVFDLGPLRQARVHLLGVYEKTCRDAPSGEFTST